MLARRLAALLPGDLDRVFFTDSGSVAVEVALKMATQYWLNRGVAGRTPLPRVPRRLSRRHHRRDGGVAIPRTGMHRLFAGLLPQPRFPRPAARRSEHAARCERHLERHADELAGIIVEPLVQGAGGMLFHPPRRCCAACARSPTATTCC